MTNKAHIIKRGTQWALLKEDADRASKIYDTKKDALEGAKKLDSLSGYDIVVHKKNGLIEKWVRAPKS